MSHKTSYKNPQNSSRSLVKKQEQASHDKPTPWPNLPNQLTSLLAKHPNLMYDITSFGCVVKSWRQSPKQCKTSKPPRLIEIDLKNRQNSVRSHVFEIPFREEFPYCYYMRRRPHNYCPGIHFKGYSHGQVVVMADNMSTCYVWEPSKRCDRFIPSWNAKLPLKACVLSSYYEYSNATSMMAITGMSSPAFAFTRCFGKNKDDYSWTFQNCTIEEPYALLGEYMKFTNAIGHNGKFYALSLQGSLAVIEEIDSCFVITSIVANRAVPQGVSRQFREYLVELDGDVLLVLLVSRKWIGSVEDVEVYRMDGERVLWERMGSIGEKALFVEDECCMGVVARRVGCKKNCVYFSCKNDEWWVFDMGSAKILPAFGSGGEGMQEFVKWEEPNLEME